VVIDTVDAAVLDSSCPLVRPVRLVKLSTAPSHEEASARSIYAMFFVVAPAMVGLARLTEERSWRASARPGVSDGADRQSTRVAPGDPSGKSMLTVPGRHGIGYGGTPTHTDAYLYWFIFQRGKRIGCCHMTSAAKSGGPTGRDDRSAFKYDVFISHSHADRNTVARIAEQLREAGISYWLDAEQITFGDPVVGKIEDGLQDSRFVVAVLSAALVRSGWCRAEYGSVLNRELSGDTTRRVIPLSLDGTADAAAIPMLLVDKLRVDFTSERSMAEFIGFLKSSRGPT
jgi:hypothetical protein